MCVLKSRSIPYPPLDPTTLIIFNSKDKAKAKKKLGHDLNLSSIVVSPDRF